MTSFWCLYCSLWTHFTHCSGVSIVGFEQFNTCWVDEKRCSQLTIKVIRQMCLKLTNRTLVWRQVTSLVPAGNDMFKINNRNTSKRCEIILKLTIKTQEWRHWRRSDVFNVNFEHISHLVLVSLLLTFNR